MQYLCQVLDPLVEPNLVESIAHFVEVQLSKLHVSCVARVERFDAERQTVDCQPLIQHEYPDEYGDRQLETLPVVTSVPVVFPRGGAGGLTFPLAAGDVVALVFTSRSHAKWLRTAGSNNPVDPEVDWHHDLSSAIAIPCARRLADAIDDFAGDAVVLDGDDVRLGDASASSQVVVQSALDAFMSAIADSITATNTSGSRPNPAVNAVMVELQLVLKALPGPGTPPVPPPAEGWTAGTTKTKAT